MYVLLSQTCIYVYLRHVFILTKDNNRSTRVTLRQAVISNALSRPPPHLFSISPSHSLPRLCVCYLTLRYARNSASLLFLPEQLGLMYPPPHPFTFPQPPLSSFPWCYKHYLPRTLIFDHLAYTLNAQANLYRISFLQYTLPTNHGVSVKGLIRPPDPAGPLSCG